MTLPNSLGHVDIGQFFGGCAKKCSQTHALDTATFKYRL